MLISLKYYNGKFYNKIVNSVETTLEEIEYVVADVSTTNVRYNDDGILFKIASKTVTLPVVGAHFVPFGKIANLTIDGVFVADGSTEVSVIKSVIDAYNNGYHKATVVFNSGVVTVTVGGVAATSGKVYYVADNGTLVVAPTPVDEGKTASVASTSGTYTAGVGVKNIVADTTITITVA